MKIILVKILRYLALIGIIPFAVLGIILFVIVLVILKPFGYEYRDYPDSAWIHGGK